MVARQFAKLILLSKLRNRDKCEGRSGTEGGAFGKSEDHEKNTWRSKATGHSRLKELLA